MNDSTYFKPLFLWQDFGQKQDVMPICRIFWQNLDITIIIMLYFW
jgi:hypothetical protein